MKKFFFFAACALASMSMMAQQPAVEFHYLPTTDDLNAAGEAYTTDKATTCTVAADEVLISGTKFTVKNAYATKYVAVGMMTDTAYNTLMIGDEAVDYKVRRIQGQDNPKDAAGGNPAISLNVPTSGACFKVEVTEPGILLVAVKSTPNKNQFAYSDLTGAGAALVATPNEYMYLSMSNNTTGTAIGNPDGCLQILVEGDEFGELHSSPETPGVLNGNGSYGTNGIGVMMVNVNQHQSPYLIGTGGSKMMAAGFGFVSANDPNIANLTVVAKGCEDKAGNPHADVVLFDKDLESNPNLKIQDCSKVLKEVKISVHVPAAWYTDTVGYGELKPKVGCYVWGNGMDGVMHEMTADKDVAGKYSYTVKADESAFPVNCIFNKGHLVTTGEGESAKSSISIDWNGENNQTIDLKGISEDICYTVTASVDGKAKATAVVNATCDAPQGIFNAFAGQKAVKSIENGKLVLKIGDKKFNVLGAEL